MLAYVLPNQLSKWLNDSLKSKKADTFVATYRHNTVTCRKIEWTNQLNKSFGEQKIRITGMNHVIAIITTAALSARKNDTCVTFNKKLRLPLKSNILTSPVAQIVALPYLSLRCFESIWGDDNHYRPNCRQLIGESNKYIFNNCTLLMKNTHCNKSLISFNRHSHIFLIYPRTLKAKKKKLFMVTDLKRKQNVISQSNLRI